MADIRPRNGDVVVRHARHSATSFTLRVRGSSREIVCPTCADTLALAKRTAEPNHSAVWFTDDETRFDLLLRFR